MHELICTDETFDPNFTIEYKLSIQVSLDGFSFCILDDIRKKFLVFKYFPFRINNASFLPQKTKKIIEQEEILAHKYKGIQILIENQWVSAIPNSEGFNENHELFLRQSFKLPSNSAFHISYNKAFDFALAFAYSGQLKALFDEKFESYKLLHQIEPTINKVSNGSLKKGTNCFVNVSAQFFTLLIFDGKKLMLLNSFVFKNKKDFLFYLLSTLEGLGLNPYNINLHISGNIDEKGSINSLLEEYSLNVSYLKFNRAYQYSYTFESFPEHKFLNVINPEG